jgi:dTDP-4-amino-4,6-dideoxygalactose transaminase
MLPPNIFRRIAPVGNPINLKTSDALPPLIDDARIKLVQSGTAALAAAVSVAKMAKAVKGKAEVIIPAYCCPDVVSAIIYNDCTPVLVDFVADQAHMDPREIATAITDNTIAVIAVNFLGLPEHCKQIRAVIQPHNIVLIEDSAQWFPEHGELFENYDGDLVIVSFGKGKPVSLLGGGAIIARNPNLPFDRLQIATPASNRPVWQQRLLFIAYNLAIHPWFYWILELLPFIEMGGTHYKPLKTIESMDVSKQRFLSSNINSYRKRTGTGNGLAVILQQLNPAVRNLLAGATSNRPLRLPVLFENPASRGVISRTFKQLGLGASQLYDNVLLDIEGVPSDRLRITGALKNAKSFTSRLLTLPTHKHLNNQRCEDIGRIMEATLPQPTGHV